MPSHEERMAPGDDDDVDIIGYGEETAALVRNISLTYDTCIPFNRPVHLDWQRSPLLKNVSFIENSYVSLPAVSLSYGSTYRHFL